jgi:phenol 2-monooxygenase
VEEYLMEYVRGHGNIDVRRETTPTTLEIDHDTIDDHSKFPIRMNLESVAPMSKSHFNNMETPSSDTSSEPHSDDSGYAEMDTVVEAKYIVGCDGARSWLRKQLRLRLEGESSSDSWGVLDIIPLTNFREFWPVGSSLRFAKKKGLCAADIRKRSIVKTKHGTLMMIPRERKLVRIYVELRTDVATRYREEQDGEVLMEQVEKIMQPYMMKTKYIDWSTTYTVRTSATHILHHSES